MTTITTNPHLPLQDATASPSSPTEQEDSYNTQIDALLTRYLLLLDEYTTLRSSLSSLQASMYQNLARANFTAERGVRYGKEYFDERMVASRRVVVKVGAGKEKGRGKGKGKGDKKEEEEEEEEEHGGRWWCEDEGEQRVEFGVGVVEVDNLKVEVVKEKDEKKEEERGEEVKQSDEKIAKQETEAVVGKDKEAKKDIIQRADTTTTTATTTTTLVSPDDSSETPSTPDNDTEADKENETKKNIRKNDPLRWFGLLTPLPLRLAQTQAIQAVEQIIPRLVTVNAEMAQVEIEVRRARKRRGKAAVKAKAAAAKDAK